MLAAFQGFFFFFGFVFDSSGAASTCSMTKHLQLSPDPALPSQINLEGTVLTLHQETGAGHGITETGSSGWDENPHLPFFLLIRGAIYEEHTGPPVLPLHCLHLERG